MSTELIQSILSIIAALIPLLILMGTLLSNWRERSFSPLDSPALKVVTIKRVPVSHQAWQGVQRQENRKCLLLSLVGLFFIFFIIVLSLFFHNELLTSLLLAIIVLYSILITYDDLKNPFFLLSPLKAKNPVEARYFVFEQAEIVIQAPYPYLLKKCVDVLRRMRLWIVEVNEVAGTVEALQLSILSLSIVSMRLHLDKCEPGTDTFLIRIEFIPEINLLQRSKLTNRFLNELISKPTSAEQKPQSKGDLPADVTG